MCGGCEDPREEQLNGETRGQVAEKDISEEVVDECADEDGLDDGTRTERTGCERQNDPVKAGEKEHMQVFWTVRAIKIWMRKWFETYLMKTWTIDNYDGQESYEALQLEIDEGCWQETPMESKMYQQLRANMFLIETEMDEVVREMNNIPDAQVVFQTMKREWHQLVKIAFSLCDDYAPASTINKAEDDARMLSSRSNSAVRIDHEPRDQDDLVVQKGHATRNPFEAEANQQMWKDQGHADHVAGQVARRTHEDEDATRHLGCFLKGQRKQSRCKRQESFEAESEDDEPEQLVCNMNGHGWGKLFFPIIIDSAVCDSVVPIEWCNHIPIQKIQGSESGEFFRAAHGVKLLNEGERLVTLMTQEGVEQGYELHCVPSDESTWIRFANVPIRPQSGV